MNMRIRRVVISLVGLLVIPHEKTVHTGFDKAHLFVEADRL